MKTNNGQKVNKIYDVSSFEKTFLPTKAKLHIKVDFNDTKKGIFSPEDFNF